jgi:hypothetical protein
MMKSLFKFALFATAIGPCCCREAEAVILTDPGFESVAVPAGGFSHAGDPAWTFVNDAGVTRPFTNPTSTGALNTWSATFSPIEGSQYASTYALLDSIRQTVAIPAGTYVLSVYAASPAGSVTIPPIGTSQLVTGAFQLTFGAQSGPIIEMPPGTDWLLSSATFVQSSAGSVAIGVRNSETAPYFVNYDAFTLELIPEPAAIMHFIIGACVVLHTRRRRC